MEPVRRLADPARWAALAAASVPVRRPVVPVRWAALAAVSVPVRRLGPARLRRAVLPDREPLLRKLSLAPDAKAVE